MHSQFQIFLDYNKSQVHRHSSDRISLTHAWWLYRSGQKKNIIREPCRFFQFIITFHSVLMVYTINDHSPHDHLSNYPLIIIQH